METFGRYELIHRIAAGGMGEIYFARSASIDGFEKELVIKRVLPGLSKDEKFVSMFIDEARVSISLAHQNVVQVFDFGEADGCYYLAMEYVEGADLGQLLAHPNTIGGGLPPGMAFFIMAEACKGLEYTHNITGRGGEALNLVHRDISPGNILVSFDGGVKVADFGIAASRVHTNTEGGGPVGKLPYMSPEHAVGEPTDRRSDVFACGVVLWELLVGSKAYTADSRAELLVRIATADIAPPSSCNPKITGTIDEIVMRAVAPDPARRYQSARELGSAIQDVLRHYRDFDSYGLQKYMAAQRDGLALPVFERTPPPRRTVTASVPVEPTGEVALPARFLAKAKAFAERPNVWRFIEMGDACAAEGQRSSALACYRVAAVKFAQSGMLAQTLLCAKRMIAQRDEDDVAADVGEMVKLIGRSNTPVIPHLFRSTGPAEEWLAQLLFKNPIKPVSKIRQKGSFLVSLGPKAFGLLAKQAPTRRYQPEERIVSQGDHGDSMYLILSGRTLVYITNDAGVRVYLASLTVGQFFGENSFFTSSPRTATVEALERVDMIEIDRPLYERIMADDSRADEVLMRLYKSRVVDAILARSATFGLLDTSQRRALLDAFELRHFGAGDVMIQQGDRTQEIYLIKSGAAEAYVTDGEAKRFIASIEPGSILGEIAALRGVPRTASVVATEAVEALCLEGEAFSTMLQSSPAVAEKVREVIETRASLQPPPLPASQG